MKRRIWPSSLRRCGRRAGKRPSISMTNSGRLAAELAISRTLSVCFWNALGKMTLTGIACSCEGQLLVRAGVLFDVGFKVAQTRTNRAALVVGAVKNVGGLETVACDAGDRQFIRLDAAVGVEARSDGDGDAACGLGEDAFGLGELLNSGDDFDVGNIFGPTT